MRCAQSGLLDPAKDVHHGHVPQGITQAVVKVPFGPRMQLAGGRGAPFPGKPEPKPAPTERCDPHKLARHYQALLDSGKFENRAALARHLVSAEQG